jgi:hypothetical protein
MIKTLVNALKFHFRPIETPRLSTSILSWQISEREPSSCPGCGVCPGPNTLAIQDHEPRVDLGLMSPEGISVITIWEMDHGFGDGLQLEFLEVSEDDRPEFQRAVQFCENYGVS